MTPSRRRRVGLAPPSPAAGRRPARRRWSDGRPLAAGLLALFLGAGCGPRDSRPAAELRSTAGAPMTEEDRGELSARLQELRRAGRATEGLGIVRQALERSPDDALLHFELGLLHRAAGDPQAAEAALTRALELEPAHYPSHRALGDMARARGAPAEAADHYRRCVAGLEAHAGCRYGLGLALAELGELDAAAEHLAAAAERLDRADAWSELGRLERRRRRSEASIAAFARALARDRHHLPALLGMGQALMAAGRDEEGRALLERHREQAALQDRVDALRRAAGQPGAPAEVWLQLARLHRSRDDPEAEEAALRQAVERSAGDDGSRPAAVLALANHLLHQGDAEQAAELVEGLSPALSGDPAVLFLQGTIDLAGGDQTAAASHFEASLARGPWPPPVYLDAGKAWLAAGFPERAAAAFERAVAGMPSSAAAHLGLAESRRAAGAGAGALAAVERALELDPADGRAWLLLGVLRTERGDRELAARAFARGLAARKLDLLAANGATEIRRQLEALDPPAEALELFDRALAARLPG